MSPLLSRIPDSLMIKKKTSTLLDLKKNYTPGLKKKNSDFCEPNKQLFRLPLVGYTIRCLFLL